MEAQELLRRAADIYAESGKEAYAPMALAKAAGMTNADIDFLDTALLTRKTAIRRAEHFFRGIADFLDQREAEECIPREGSVADYAMGQKKDSYCMAVEDLATDRYLAIMYFGLAKGYTLESIEKYSKRFDTAYKAHLYDQQYKSELGIIARIFGKSMEEVRLDVLNNPISGCIPKGEYDEY